MCGLRREKEKSYIFIVEKNTLEFQQKYFDIHDTIDGKTRWMLQFNTIIV